MKAKRLAPVWALCGVVALTGCAMAIDATVGLFSFRVSATAIVGGDLLQGQLRLYVGRSGEVALATPAAADGQAAGAPATQCAGRLHYTDSGGGTVYLRCNGRSGVVLRFAMLSDTSGYAYGTQDADQASMTFGLDAPQALAYLRAPANRQLVPRADGKGLELQWIRG